MHIAICSDLDQRNGEAARLNERHRIAGQQSVALDRAGITVFPDIDTHPMDEDGHSRKRFRTAIEKLFKPISGEYDAGCMCKNGMHDRYCLYKGLKCGMAHIGHPQCSIAFTTRAEAKVDKTAHLVKDSQGNAYFGGGGLGG